jgi:thioredoxin reductase
MDGAKSAYTYKVIEKNKKIAVIGSGVNGTNEVIEIRNLSKTAMTFYQERVVNNNKYIWYIDFKKQ